MMNNKEINITFCIATENCPNKWVSDSSVRDLCSLRAYLGGTHTDIGFVFNFLHITVSQILVIKI